MADDLENMSSGGSRRNVEPLFSGGMRAGLIDARTSMAHVGELRLLCCKYRLFFFLCS
jgi:hypothetical protein